MIVTDIKLVNKKQEIYIDDKASLRLFKKELKSYGIVKEMEIDQELIDKILVETIIPRGMVYTGHLLARKDYTESQIEQKLMRGLYGEKATRIIIDKLKNYGFINDESYTRRFYEYKKDKYSKGDIVRKLYTKGIPKDLINKIIEENQNGDYEGEALRKYIAKKIKHVDINDRDKKNKLIRHLLYKGYPYDKIKHALKEYDE